jgi:trimeric autotransporter adhesin
VTSPAANSFTVRASGGIWLGTTSSPSIGAGRFIDTSTHAYLSSGGMWVDNSSRTLKHDFRPLNTQSVLVRIARLPIRSWSYKAEKPTVRHAGPTAEDFCTAFRLGLDNRHISAIDAAGIALAAIQALSREAITLQRANRALRARLGSDEARLTRLEREITILTHQETRASTG